MNIFIVHSGEDYDIVKEKKEELKKKCDSANVLLLDHRMAWKSEVHKLMKETQIVFYIVGKNSYKSKNIDWELREALKQQKSILCYKIDNNNELNEILKAKDSFTKEEIELADEVKSIDHLVDIITKYENGEHINLLNAEIGENNLFEQYKLFTETSEALVNRRQNVNSFYITANTALMTVAATAFSLNGDMVSKLLITIALTIPGILLNHSWHRILESYGLINSSKMKILGMLEKKLTASLYDAEWQVMSHKYNKKTYVSFTDSEKSIPRIFSGVYLVIDIICVAFLLVMLVK